MSLTTKPPAAAAPIRPDAAPPGATRPPAARSLAFDESAAVALLLRELAVVVAAERGLNFPPPDSAASSRDPRATVAALVAWLRGASEASGAPPERLAMLIERAYARVLEILSRLPAGRDSAEASVRLARNVLLAELAGAAPAALRPHPAGALPLKVLVAELERAVFEELGPVPSAPRPPSGEDPGNVAAALLRWLRAVTADAAVPLARLRGPLDRALDRTRAILAEDAAAPEAIAELDKAREVLLAAIGRAPRATSTLSVPTFRPDLPVAPLGIGARARGDRNGNRRAAHHEADIGAEGEPEEAADEPASAPAALDLRGPMQLVRRYIEDCESGEAGACAQHFVFPACRWQGGRWQAYADAPALTAAHATQQQALLSGGARPAKILMLRVEPLGPTIATVRALIGRDGRPGVPAEEVEVAYTTVRTAAGWRIAVLMRR